MEVSFNENKPSITYAGTEYEVPYYLWRMVKYIYEKKQVRYEDLAKYCGIKLGSLKQSIMLVRRKIPGIPITTFNKYGYIWLERGKKKQLKEVMKAMIENGNNSEKSE